MIKYQVFISSTFIDLRDVRKEVVRALLENNCIPVAMESFAAAGESAFDYIKRAIDESDYFLLIVGNNYGSIAGTSGKSFTEIEYEYANDIGKPILAFITRDEELYEHAHSTVRESKDLSKLITFRKRLLESHLCKFYKNPNDLGSIITNSIVSLTRDKSNYYPVRFKRHNYSHL
jgi:hypothetical protein